MQRKIIKESILIAGISSIAAGAYAVNPGMYLGIGFGPATNSAKDQIVRAASPPYPPGTTTKAKPKSNQFGSELYAGYKMNKWAAWELGFNYFTNINYTSKLEAEHNTSSRIRTINLLGKGYLPFWNSFDVFAKAGVAVSYLTFSGSLSSTGKNKYEIKYSPMYAIGASYDLNQSFVVDVSLNQIAVGNKVFGSVTFAAISLSYHIVEVYCGQFLC